MSSKGTQYLAQLAGNQPYSYFRSSSLTTQVVKSGAGVLHSINVNTTAASGVITLYDNTAGSGTIIAQFTSPATLLESHRAGLLYDTTFSTGLTVVQATAIQDVTLSYR